MQNIEYDMKEKKRNTKGDRSLFLLHLKEILNIPPFNPTILYKSFNQLIELFESL